ncbi:PaaX family transcriptional regulator C-terminal domain-containing protein [Streptomyces microflavus]|uniref:PaaX family transcriptional regulator C-terminal domain-containing protein n=1 Tax=Streptomyces microflavus TaxID=1919 RepID=UPI0037FF515E
MQTCRPRTARHCAGPGGGRVSHQRLRRHLPGPATPPPRSSDRQRGHSHTGPGGQRPHCRTAKNITGGGEREREWVPVQPAAELAALAFLPGGCRCSPSAHGVGLCHELVTVELAAELTRAMEPDPLLPPQLLPQPWPGTQARELIARCWAVLHERGGGEARPALFRIYADITREAADRTAR